MVFVMALRRDDGAGPLLRSDRGGGELSMHYLEGERDMRVSAPGASGFR